MLNPEEIQAFLKQTHPALLGVIGTIDSVGAPHVVPVWYDYDGTFIYIWTHPDRHWVKNVGRNGRVAFSVQEGQPPFTAVVMKGQAEIMTGQDEAISVYIERIVRRYLPEIQVASYIQQWSALRTIVTITPDKIIGWGTGY